MDDELKQRQVIIGIADITLTLSYATIYAATGDGPQDGRCVELLSQARSCIDDIIERLEGSQ